MDKMSLLFVFMVSLPEAILVAVLGLVLTGFRPGWRQLAAIGFIQALIAYFVRLAPVPYGAHSFLLAFLFVCVIRLVTRVDWRAAAVAALLGLTIYQAIETAIAPVLLYLTGYQLTYVVQHPYMRIFFFFPEGVLLGLLIWLCIRFDFKLIGPPPGYEGGDNEWRSLNRSYLLVYLLIVIPVLLLGTLNMAFYVSRFGTFSEKYVNIFLMGMSITVMVLVALTPMKIQAVSRAVGGLYAARKNAEILTHIGELLRMIRRQHHDFHNQLQVVYGLLETGCCDEAREYIKRTYEEINVPAELIRTDNPHVTALLYTKMALAETKGIRLEPAIECSLKGLPLNVLEVGSLFGNLVDNAIEAVQNAPEEERVVRLGIKLDAGGYQIKVGNRGRLAATQHVKIFQSGYTTKEGHAGLGLARVREIARKHGGGIEVSCDGAETVFRVTIPVSKDLKVHLKNKSNKFIANL